MNIYRELSGIASAKYGLGLKDPIYYALAKLVEDPKFELLHDMLNDDVTDFDNYLDYLFSNNETCAVLANFARMIYILNGRKAFYGPNEPPISGVELTNDNVLYWISMLGNELMHSGNRQSSQFNAYGIAWTGDGLINGSKIRAAMYYILEILSKSNNEVYEEPTVVAKAPFCFFGKDFEEFLITGTADGIGYLNPDDNEYYIDLVVKDIFNYDDTETRIPILLGNQKLYDSSTVRFTVPSGTTFSHSFYQIAIMEKDKDTNALIEVSYNALRDIASANPEDYEYELYGTNNQFARTLLYKGNDEALAVPDRFDGAPTRKLGPFTYYGKKIKKIYVIDGITTIE